MSEQAKMSHLDIDVARGTQSFLKIPATNPPRVSEVVGEFDMDMEKASPESCCQALVIFPIAQAIDHSISAFRDLCGNSFAEPLLTRATVDLATNRLQRFPGHGHPALSQYALENLAKAVVRIPRPFEEMPSGGFSCASGATQADNDTRR